MILYRHQCHEEIHQDQMAGAAAHYKQMEDFVGTEVLVPGVEQGKLQRINDAAHGVDDPSCQQPSEGCAGKTGNDLGKSDYAGPSHGNIENGGEPFRAGNPAGFHDDAEQCDTPHQSAEHITGSASQHDQADGGIGACDQNEDHHMINFS